MPVYQSAEQFYAVLDEGFRRMAADPQALADFQRRRMAVSLRTVDPETFTTIDGRANPAKVTFGSATGRPDLGLTMSTDLLHAILMDQASIKESFLSGKVQVTGNVFRAMQLAELFHQIQRVYPQVHQNIAPSEQSSASAP